MILALLLACQNMNLCNASVTQIAGPSRWSSRADCGPFATATVQVIDDKVYAVCSCPCDDKPDDLTEPEPRIEHR